MKPPSSPKWLFVPSTLGSIRANIMEVDESDRVILNVEAPSIFQMDMWKQSDPMRLSVLGNTVDANTTYTFFIEGNYSKAGMDSWDAMNLQLIVAGWYDNGEIGTNSIPGDPTWSTDDHRTRQFRLTYSPGNVPAMQYPFGSPGEFSIHSYHVSAGHGPDGSHRRVYMNVTIGPQAAFSFGNLAQATVSPYHPNTALNDPYLGPERDSPGCPATGSQEQHVRRVRDEEECPNLLMGHPIWQHPTGFRVSDSWLAKPHPVLNQCALHAERFHSQPSQGWQPDVELHSVRSFGGAEFAPQQRSRLFRHGFLGAIHNPRF